MICNSGRSLPFDQFKQCKQVREFLPQTGLYFLWDPGKSKVKSLRDQANGQFAKKESKPGTQDLNHKKPWSQLGQDQGNC